MSIESLRAFRAKTETTIILELASITRHLVEQESRYRTARVCNESEMARYCSMMAHGAPIEDVVEGQGRLDASEEELALVRQAIAALTDAWNSTQARLLEARQERKILDRVAEKRLQGQRADTDRREQLALDEAGHRLYQTAGKRVA